jgi:hypothetical protein
VEGDDALAKLLGVEPRLAPKHRKDLGRPTQLPIAPLDRHQ